MKKVLAILVALVMALAVLSACGGGGGGEDASGTSGKDSANDGSKPLVVGYSNFSSKFSPFFSETAYDQDVWAMTSVNLLDVDRLGAIVEKGVSVEKIPYNGTDYEYPGMADLTITENADGTVDYDFALREGVTFSDGEPLTADDVIFTMYVFADPTYNGSGTFFSLPIEGMEAYRSGMDTLANLIFAAGRDATDFTLFTEEEYNDYWTKYDASTAALAKDIIDYCLAEGYATDAAGAASAWGFDGATNEEELAAALSEAYGADVANMISTEAATISIDDYFPNFEDYSGKGVKTGDSADSITGIQKTGDYGVKVKLTEVSAPAIYQLSLPIAPMHYYGDKALYDYDNNSFGFTKGDLSAVRAKTTEPMGAGPYVFNKFENGVVYFTANDSYFLGAPKIKNLQFMETNDTDKLNGVITGTIDITDPSFSKDTAKAISEANSNGEITGDKITTSTVNNLGYGYLGISAQSVKVGNDPASDASKNLRKAFATVYSVYRDVTVDSYYGEAASVINYPISDTSWAAPQKTDSDYAIAFSKDVDGNDIYTSDMDADAKADAALKAALGYFEAAGYTVTDGKVTAAPEGASLEYEVWIPADGAGDHPSFMMLNLASDALKTIGITLTVKDLANSSDLWSGLEAGQVPMWCAAWGATPDPDMYQVYYSGIESGQEPGGSNYMYDIEDADLDKLIIDARASLDQPYRKQLYKAALDIIVDWAVEVPVYQRQNAITFSTERVKIDTVTPDITTYYGWLREIQNTELA
ncbi:MAG: ABC transporter substrate-binding protein [Clostridia bacterium]|nr:ABC transporter substrate-binding protein [Clostridia bacterium]